MTMHVGFIAGLCHNLPRRCSCLYPFNVTKFSHDTQDACPNPIGTPVAPTSRVYELVRNSFCEGLCAHATSQLDTESAHCAYGRKWSWDILRQISSTHASARSERWLPWRLGRTGITSASSQYCSINTHNVVVRLYCYYCGSSCLHLCHEYCKYYQLIV